MKLSITIILMMLATTYGNTFYSEKNTPVTVEGVIESIRKVIKNGDPQKDVPVLDPYEQENYDINVPGTLISFKVEGKHGQVSGLSDFVVKSVQFNRDDLTLKYNINLPRVTVQSPFYSMSGYLYSALPIYGRGGVLYYVNDLDLFGVAQLRVSKDGKSILIDEIKDSTFTIKSVKSFLTGFLGGGDIDNIANQIIEDLAPEYLTRFSAQVSKLTTPLIRDVVNKYAERFETAYLLNASEDEDGDFSGDGEILARGETEHFILVENV